eukprot:scaffold110939_cov20-Prasinocladus_malaysianus.AAC.1
MTKIEVKPAQLHFNPSEVKRIRKVVTNAWERPTPRVRPKPVQSNFDPINTRRTSEAEAAGGPPSEDWQRNKQHAISNV